MPETAPAQITVEVGRPPWTEEVIGWWLVEPDPRDTRGGDDAGGYWGVIMIADASEAGFIPSAQTAMSRGVIPTAQAAQTPRAADARRFAVYWQHVNGVRPAHLDYYDDLDAAAADGVPDEILSQAAHACGRVYPVRLDV